MRQRRALPEKGLTEKKNNEQDKSELWTRAADAERFGCISPNASSRSSHRSSPAQRFTAMMNSRRSAGWEAAGYRRPGSLPREPEIEQRQFFREPLDAIELDDVGPAEDTGQIGI